MRQHSSVARALNIPLEGRVESAKEFLLILKTSRGRFRALERSIRSLHTYDVPEIIALPVIDGSPAYLKWVSQSVAARK